MRVPRTLAALVTAVLLLGPVRAAADEAPFPAGMSSQQLEGLKCSVVMPEAFDPAKPHSLLVVLHGAGGTETGMAGTLSFLAKEDFVVVAPKSKGQTWDAGDLEAVKRIVAGLTKRLNVPELRLHGVGFSNGGWNLGPVVFDEQFRFASATWVASGCTGGKVPKYAKKGMGVLALAGANDPNRGSAESTPKVLEDKVRSAEVRIEPGIGHEWPDKQMPYLGWWLGVQEGRFVPGVTLAFEWVDSLEAALPVMKEKKTGGFAYWYSKDDSANAAAKSFQNDTMQDRAVRFFGRQLAAWKLDRTEHGEEFAAAGLKATPAVVVYDAAGKPKTALQGEIAAKSLAAALKSVAPEKSLPR